MRDPDLKTEILDLLQMGSEAPALLAEMVASPTALADVTAALIELERGRSVQRSTRYWNQTGTPENEWWELA